MREINREQVRANLPELAMGIGINTGEVVVGNLGSQRRAKYGAVGTPINMTYRIESYTTGGQILISAATHEKVRTRVQVRQTMEVQFKGMDRPLRLYDISGMEGDSTCTLAEVNGDPCIALETPLPIRYFLVEDKAVSQRARAGFITHLLASGARVTLEDKVPPYANLKILLDPGRDPKLSDVYAKLVAIEEEGVVQSRINGKLVFSFLPDDVRTFLDNKRSGSDS